jgi:hypothetical protein
LRNIKKSNITPQKKSFGKKNGESQTPPFLLFFGFYSKTFFCFTFILYIKKPAAA